MATSPGALNLISDLVDEVKGDQSTFARKANTVTSAIGTVATLLSMFLVSWLESGTNLPSWLPGAVLICGLLATTYGVSKTKNGFTESVTTKLQDGLVKRIDLNHIHTPVDIPETVKVVEPVDKALELRSHADELTAYCALNHSATQTDSVTHSSGD